nr:hypothetical protein [Actinomycetota bacterium]
MIPVPEWDEPPKARIAELLIAVQDRLGAAGVAGLVEVVALARGAATAAGLADPRITSDVKHVEIGLTDKSDSASWAAVWLAQRGIGAGLVLVGGDEFGPIGGVSGSDSFMLVAELARAAVVSVGVEPGGVPGRVVHAGGGPDRWLQILEGQLGRRRDRRVPWVDEDPAWVLRLSEAPELERAAEAIGVVGNGWAALRAAREDDGVGSAPQLLVNGVYTAGPTPELLAGPRWAHLAVRSDHRRGRRLLDLRSAVLAGEGDDPAGIRTFRFVSAARPSGLALRAEGPASVLGTILVGAGDRDGSDEVPGGEVHEARTGDCSGSGIAVAARDWEKVTGGRRVIQRLAAWTAHRSTEPGSGDARDQLAELEAVGFDRLLDEHRRAWALRWADAEVSIDGPPGDQLATRF